MKVVYFAWLRERIGLSEEMVEADGLATVADLVAHLKGASDAHAMAFEDMAAVRVAVNMKVADYDAPLAGATEVAEDPEPAPGERRGDVRVARAVRVRRRATRGRCPFRTPTA